VAADSVLPALPSYDFIAYGACITWSSQRRFTTGCVPSKVQSAVKAASTTRGGFVARGLSYVDKCHMSKRALERHSWPVLMTSNHFLSLDSEMPALPWIIMLQF
jgi:hypothetical protein